MRLPAVALLLPLCCCAPALPAQEPAPAAAPAAPVTLDEAMADPAWIARSPERARWSADGRLVLYSREDVDGVTRSWAVDPDGGEPWQLSPEEEAALPPGGGSWDAARERRLLTLHGDLFLQQPDGALVQLCRTSASESRPFFLRDGRSIAFRRDGTLLVRDLESGFEYEPAVLRAGEAEQEDAGGSGRGGNADGRGGGDADAEYLEEQQGRLFPHFARDEERREARRAHEEARRAAREAVDAGTAMPEPFHVGKGRQPVDAELSPDGRWMLVRTRPESRGRGAEAPRDRMPRFVTEDSWVAVDTVRGHVGFSEPEDQGVMLLDLDAGVLHPLDLASLPGIADDPLAFLRADAAADAADAGAEAKPAAAADTKPRPVWIRSVEWAPDASTVVFQARSFDSKDLWIVAVDLESAALEVVHHLHDPAWVNGRFAEMGWRRDGAALWFTSEAGGWSQLHAWDPRSGAVRALTEGTWEVSDVEPTPDGAALVFRANREHRGIHELYRVGFDGGPVERLTELGGDTSGSLSPDGSRLLLTSSSILQPQELYVQDCAPGAAPRRLTHTVEQDFLDRDWVLPQLVEVPTRHGRPVTARLYLPRDPAPGPRPAVCFVHGAGYLQNAHYGWSSYVREFLFHQLLVARGYVVIDADYRASAGHGRDWRTAIYRDMGQPELEDYLDCVAWMAAEHQVDPARVGIYGGSYGGFVTLMALFRAPGSFAAGAALRPVTDWAHYHHGYTAPRLNTPAADPEAYARSSPIEYAEGLADALLICHGMVDDNVLAKDSIRLAQRLIELGKDDWELALYPIEPHAFREPASWRDEYRRILELFEERLR